jgi:autotransporter-associated beta strand protein
VVSKLDAIGFPSPLGNPPGGSTNLIFYNSPTLRVAGESYTDRGLTLNAGTNTIEVTNAADQLTIAGVITGAGALQKFGAGSLAVSVNNTFTGPTFITGGNLSLGGGTANQYGLGIGPSGNGNTTITISNATLTMFSDSASYDTCNWNLVVPTNTTATIFSDDRCNLYGSLTGGGTLNFNVYYVRCELDGNWSGFTGQLNLGTDSAGGDFRIGNSSGYGSCSVNLADHIFAYHITAGAAVSLGAVSGSSLATMGGTAWTVGGKNTDATYAGSITGNSITKVGTGTWTISGATNTYTGATTISAGTLLVHGNLAPATGTVTVAAAGTLGGNGTLGGVTTVSGKISPGASIGLLTFTNNVTLASGSTTFIEISKTPKTNDVLKTLRALTLGGTLTVTNLAGTPALGDSFKILDAVTLTGNFTKANLPQLTTGLTWNRTTLASTGTITIVTNTTPALTGANLIGVNLALTYGGGVPGALYYLIGSTNLALPVAQWTPLTTNYFAFDGTTSVNATVYADPPQKFFRLLVP